MAPVRHPLWEQRLTAYLRSLPDREHVYGTLDCILHAANAIEAVTGVDPAELDRGSYRSQAGAVRHLRAKGFETPEQLLVSMLDEVPIGLAQRGDLALTPANEGEEWAIPGVIVGDVALCMAPTGIIIEPRVRWLCAWMVGR